MLCAVCNGVLKKGVFNEECRGYALGEFEGFICTKCGETLLNENSVRQAEAKAKELGIFCN